MGRIGRTAFTGGIPVTLRECLSLFLLSTSLCLPTIASANVTGTLLVTPTVSPGNPVTIRLNDADLNTDTATPQSINLTVVNNASNESETVSLSELGNNSGVFIGTLATKLDTATGTPNDGVMHFGPGKTATATYIDLLDNSGASATITAVTNATGGSNFFANFLGPPAYYLPVFPLNGEQFGGDLTASYQQFYVPASASKELLILGEYPRARYFAITVYDDHGAIIDTMHDAQIAPLKPADINPYSPGGPANSEDILYAIRVQLGDQLVQNPQAGCQLDGVDTQSNIMDGRVRHTAGSRYSSDQSGFMATLDDGSVVLHDDSTNSEGVWVIIRTYLAEKDGGTGAFNLKTPLVFLRDSTTGCAENMFKLAGRTQTNPNKGLPRNEWAGFYSTIDFPQMAAHEQHEKDLPPVTPFGLDPNNRAAWYGGPEYILGDNPDTGYLATSVGAKGAPEQLNLDGKVMRVRFRLPQVPCDTPSCALTGLEELRYWGLSFVEGKRHVFASISDLDVNPDENGYVNLIITFGTPLPPRITKFFGYSVLELPVLPLRLITMRNILPSVGFSCAIDNVPFRTNEHNDQNGYLGEYAPFIDYLVPTDLPVNAVPRVEAGSCQ